MGTITHIACRLGRRFPQIGKRQRCIQQGILDLSPRLGTLSHKAFCAKPCCFFAGALPASSFECQAKSKIQRRSNEGFQIAMGMLKSTRIPQWLKAQGTDTPALRFQGHRSGFAKSNINGGLDAVHGIRAWGCHKYTQNVANMNHPSMLI